MSIALVLAVTACGVWVVLLAARGRFWLATERDEADHVPGCADPWPAVVAIVPARDEAGLIGCSIGALLRSRYAGSFAVILVDDQSADRTVDEARRSACAAGAEDRLRVVPGAPRPDGWTGKLWAVAQGIRVAQAQPDPPDYYLLTDADIEHAPDSLLHLVARARAGNLALASIMATLRCTSAAERALIPAFVFFFQMLYPFSWVNQPRHRTAAAAGGCMLVERIALEAAGGVDAVRSALIDDCAIARRLKSRGPIWLGLSPRVRSLRAYHGTGAIRAMVARCAYAQLRYSPLLLAGTALAMAVTFVAPPVLAFAGTGAARIAALAAWGAMSLAMQPVLRLYRCSPLWGLALPSIAAAYLVFTLDSAWQHWRGRGGMWKGRAQALPPLR